jgi:serine/threonine protein kinase
MRLTTGNTLGPYEIVAPIGAGGMGEVYRARDTRLGRNVALKVLPETFARCGAAGAFPARSAGARPGGRTDRIRARRGNGKYLENVTLECALKSAKRSADREAAFPLNFASFSRASSSEGNHYMFKHSSRRRPLKLSMNPFSTGRPGRIKHNRTLSAMAQASSARPENSLH